ncbi:hypothetical protein [Paraliomyxa miuraensis]|uniref:hypothetical protein n=1 Tax=Paraliomyxa miuraensis TaxID=376150 RepID=UPI00224C9C3D|nr:hypothetical protein [Paraliomyxa miuraensis]MCX4243080.1 hypothetical protein [Paraliomyxa miuraensis]
MTKRGYPLLFLPDANNDALQREGKPPVYHWLPNTVRLAQKDNGDYKFSFLHFVGVRNESTNVGVTGTQEVAGALVGLSTTSAPPPDVLKEAESELIERFRGNDDHYWGWRSGATPMFRPAPIVSNTVSITPIAPLPDGSMPTTTPAAGGAPTPAGGPPSRAPLVRVGQRPPLVVSPRTFPTHRAARTSNLDAWYCNLEGKGPGSVTPFAENAFSGLVGSYPAAIIYGSFHGSNSPITVSQFLQVKVWSPYCEVEISGDWSRIQDHFSAAVHAGGWFWSADLKAEFNSMRVNNVIDVKIRVDSALPNADKLTEAMEKRSDLVFQKFMEQAQKMIFEPAPFKQEAAQASSGFLGLGGGGAVKLRRDRVDASFYYHEKRQVGYLQLVPISGQLEGLYDQLEADPAAESKYFMTVDLGDWERKVSRVVKPVVNWPDPARKWVGEPVAFLSAQIGYPDKNGALQWTGHVFQPSDPPDASWSMGTAFKKKDEVTNPPAGWEPDRTFVKRTVHFSEPPSEAENPFVRVSVEKNVVELDPGDNGVPLSDLNLEVRVDNVGAINCGPIFLNTDLENDKQIVEVTFQAEGKTLEGRDRAPVRFSWRFADQNEPRYWMVFTGDPDHLPKFKYQVRVLVKGGIFTKGKEWIGPWQEASGNGPLMVSVPTPEEQGVTTRELVIPMTPSQPAAEARPSIGRPPAGRTAPPATPPRGIGTPPLRVDGWSIEPPGSGPATTTTSTPATRTRELVSAPTTEEASWSPLRPQPKSGSGSSGKSE